MKKALPILVGVLLAALTISTVVFSVELIRLKDEIAAIPAPTQGPSGPEGPQGATGPTGASGRRGAIGPTGSPAELGLAFGFGRYVVVVGSASCRDLGGFPQAIGEPPTCDLGI